MIFTVILIFVSLAFAILAWKNLKLALILLSGLLPTYLIRFSVGPIPTTMLEIFILIAIFIWLVHYNGWRIRILSLRPWIAPIFLLLAAACFAVVVASDTFSALGIWKAYFVEPILVYLMARATFESREDWLAVFKALAISAIVVSLVAIGQYLFDVGIPVPWDIERRVTGVFDYPNALGLFLAPIISMSVVLLFSKSKIVFKLILLATTVLGSIAIVLAQTEAALVAIPVGLLIALLLSVAHYKIKISALLLSIVAATLIFAFVPIAREKILLQDYSGQVRISQWTETFQLLKHQPIFGAGLNGYPMALAPYHDPKLYEIFQYPHNVVLNIWSELGILGLIAFAWILYLAVRSQRADKNDLIKLAAFTALTVMIIHGMVDVPYFKNDLSVLTWLMLAVLSTVDLKNKN